MSPFLAVSCCARNEGDILDAFIAFHLSQGADLVLVTDHASDDETAAILEQYAPSGRVLSFPVDDQQVRQGEWMTRMAEVATELGATWIVNADADEFWLPRLGSLREIFLALPEDVDVLHAFPRDFLPAPGAHGFSAEHQTLWDARLGAGFYAQHYKAQVAHRAQPGIRVHDGNHRVSGRSKETPLGWLPIDILHFPVRSFAQLERKVVLQFDAWTRTSTPPRHITSLHDIHTRNELREFYDRLVDEVTVAEGVGSGWFIQDTRLAEALGRMQPAQEGFLAPGGSHVPAVDPSLVLPEQVKRDVFLATTAVELASRPLRKERKALRQELARYRQDRRPTAWRRLCARASTTASRVLGWKARGLARLKGIRAWK